MEQKPLPSTIGHGSSDLNSVQERRQHSLAPELHIAIGSDASFKVGTCEHCVLFEEGRPARAWDADGDKELDFDRDTYFANLVRLGIVINERQAYVCP